MATDDDYGAFAAQMNADPVATIPVYDVIGKPTGEGDSATTGGTATVIAAIIANVESLRAENRRLRHALANALQRVECLKVVAGCAEVKRVNDGSADENRVV